MRAWVKVSTDRARVKPPPDDRSPGREAEQGSTTCDNTPAGYDLQLMAAHHHSDGAETSRNRVAAAATLHCLTGCAIGEVLGMVLGTAFSLGNAATVALAVALAFVFGYSLTMLPLLRAGLVLAVALPLAFASDSISIAVMEVVDNGVVLGVPGAMDATLGDLLFWGPLAGSLVVAFAAAFPVNRYLIARGQGHAVVHAYHGHGGHGEPARRPAPGPLVLLGLGAIAVTLAVTVGSAWLVAGVRI
jgi:hypothetical protein